MKNHTYDTWAKMHKTSQKRITKLEKENSNLKKILNRTTRNYGSLKKTFQ